LTHFPKKVYKNDARKIKKNRTGSALNGFIEALMSKGSECPGSLLLSETIGALVKGDRIMAGKSAKKPKEINKKNLVPAKDMEVKTPQIEVKMGIPEPDFAIPRPDLAGYRLTPPAGGPVYVVNPEVSSSGFKTRRPITISSGI
jgi:hypothetical protein